MPTAADLAAAASKSPQYYYAQNAPNCHDAVMSWLVEANFITKQSADRIRSIDTRNPYQVYQTILARESDPWVMPSSTPAAGQIVGFYANGYFGHSMVTVAPGVLGGLNNVYVGGGADYTQIALKDLAWNGNVVGPNGYQVHVATVTDFTLRAAAALVSL